MEPGSIDSGLRRNDGWGSRNDGAYDHTPYDDNTRRFRSFTGEAASPAAAMIDRLSVVDLPGLLPSVADIAGLATETVADSPVIMDGRELRFVRGRTAVRAIVVGVFQKTDAASARAMAEIIAKRIEPFMTAATPTPQP